MTKFLWYYLILYLRQKMANPPPYFFNFYIKLCNIYLIFYILFFLNDIRLLLIYRSLKRFDDETLARQPDDVFDIICKIGRGYVRLIF